MKHERKMNIERRLSGCVVLMYFITFFCVFCLLLIVYCFNFSINIIAGMQDTSTVAHVVLMLTNKLTQLKCKLLYWIC